MWGGRRRRSTVAAEARHLERSVSSDLEGEEATFDFCLSTSIPVLTTSTYVVAWPQGDHILGGGHVTHGARAEPQNPEKTKKKTRRGREKKKDKRRNHLILVGKPPDAQAVP